MNAQTFNALMNQHVPRLTLRQRELLKKRLDELDEQQKGLAVIESSRATEPRYCPHCQGSALYRHGRVSGLQRYRCRTCRRIGKPERVNYPQPITQVFFLASVGSPQSR